MLRGGRAMSSTSCGSVSSSGQTESTSPPVDPSQSQQPETMRITPQTYVDQLGSDLFTPQTMRIGPYHVQAGSYLLQSTGVKNKAVQYIVERRRVDLESLKAVLSSLENEVRPCYTHLPEDRMSSEEFSKMLLLDGCYLLCRFMTFERRREACDGGAGSSIISGGGCRSNGGGGRGSSRRGGDVGGDIAADPMILDKDNTLVRDILYLLENQIPLCVLEAILNYISGTENEHYAPDYIYSGVCQVLQKQQYISKNRNPVASTPSDLLHLVYSYFRRRPDDVPPGSAQARCLTGTGRWRRATDYSKYADLQFRRREFQEDQQWTILDVVLEGGTLYIPFLQVDTDTWTMLRNLMALEEQEMERPVTAYCLFMSQLACTAEDVQLLQEAMILQHCMPNDKEAAKAFSYLCNGVAMDIDSLDRNYLKSVWHDLQKRCSNRVHNFKGFFREEYCSTVFYRLVFLVAILSFFSEVTQTFYAVIAYHKPTSS